MEIIEGTALSRLCDYSFGDHLSVAEPDYIRDSHYEFANAYNREFLDKCYEMRGKIMTLFIDNVRLYGRPVKTEKEIDRQWIQHHQDLNDLLALCYSLPQNLFVIFTSHEDTPIDKHIVVPTNVLGIHAVNALYFNDRIHPFPYGLQRGLGEDNRLSIMKANVEKDEKVEPNKLLYINCGIGRNKDREPLAKFETNEWVTTRFDKDSKFFPYDRYQDFLDEIKNHKFMICPEGHGMDCHRNWESLYLRRVPVMKNHPYFHKLMKGFPVLWVNEWADVTETLLRANNDLYEQALALDLKLLDLKVMYDKIMSTYKVIS